MIQQPVSIYKCFWHICSSHAQNCYLWKQFWHPYFSDTDFLKDNRRRFHVFCAVQIENLWYFYFLSIWPSDAIVLAPQHVSHVVLRPTSRAWIIFFEVLSRPTYPFPTFTAGTLRHVVTLTLNVRSVSAVAWSNSTSNFSEIEQSVASIRFVKKAVGEVEAPRGGVWPGEGAMPPPQKIFDFFHFKIVHSGAFSYTNSKVLFAIKCKERYVM